MKFLVLTGMLSLTGGKFALKGEQIDESALAEPAEVYIEMGAIRPVTDDGEMPAPKIAGSIDVHLDKQVRAELDALRGEDRKSVV